MNEEQLKLYYDALERGETPPVVGKAFIDGEWIDVYHIKRGLAVRVIYFDKEKRRVTKYLSNESVIEKWTQKTF